MPNVELKANTLEFSYGSQAPGGYAWGFPKGNDAGNIGLGVLGSKLNDKRPLDYLKKFVAQHFPNGKPVEPVSYTHLRAHETGRNLVCRLLLEKKKLGSASKAIST